MNGRQTATGLTRATASVRRAQGEVDVFLAVQTDDVARDVHHLLPHSAHSTSHNQKHIHRLTNKRSHTKELTFRKMEV